MILFTKKLNDRFHIEASLDIMALASANSADEVRKSGAVRIRIVKTSNGDAIPDDEPLFLLRARDNLALPLLCYFQTLCAGCCTDYQIKANAEAIAEFARFRDEHPERMKQPGITRGL